nr:MAG: ORF1a protein [Wufeng shrew astrovirus 1]
MDPKDRAITASSVTTANEWVTYVWDGVAWSQVATAPDDQAVILVCALMNDRRTLKEEISGLKNQLMTKDAELTTLRSELARLQPTPMRRFSAWTMLAFMALILSFFLTPTQAIETSSTSFARDPEIMMKLNEELSRFIGKAKHQNITKSVTEYYADHFNTRVITYYTMVKEHVWERYNSIPVTGYQQAVFHFLSLIVPWAWEIVAFALACGSIFTGQRTLMNIIYLAVATVTQMRFIMIAIAPLQTPYTVFVSVFLSANYLLDPLVAVAFSILHLMAFSVIGLFLTDVDYLVQLRASCSLTLAYTGYWLCSTCGIAPSSITIVLFVWRIWRLLNAVPPNVIEVRDSSGKVVNRTPATPGYLFRFKQALKTRFANPFRQVRTTQTPLARINPSALCHVSTSSGKGTGFFCGNYIVTAGHVVGNNSTVRVCYFGKNYDTNVKKVGEKDFALLSIPSDLMKAPRLKISKKHCCDWVCICAPDGDGAYMTAVTEGHDHGDTYSYVTPTRDGMSGAPLLDTDGHVLGVHQTNTGYTGGAIRLDLDDVQDQPKPNPKLDAANAEIEELRKQLAALSGMQQCGPQHDIVALVRAAMQREIQVLRDEMFGQKKKHKTKHGRGRKHTLRAGARKKRQRGPMFTEEEYQEMLDNGIDKDEIKALAEQLYEERSGFPEWSDPELSDDGWEFGSDFAINDRDTDEYESDYEDNTPDTEFARYEQAMRIPLCRYLMKVYNKEDVKEMLQSLAPLEKKVCAKQIEGLNRALNDGNDHAISLGVAALDRRAASCGLPPVGDDLGFVQRLKPKNEVRAPNTKGPKNSKVGKKSLSAPSASSFQKNIQ